MPDIAVEMPEDIKGIYQHETDYIDYDIYEKYCQKLYNFSKEIEKSQGENFIENHLLHVTEVGSPSNTSENGNKNDTCKQIYDKEQNEILQLNAEISVKRRKDIENENNRKNVIENKDMSGDPIILPVYKSTVHGQCKVMFANKTSEISAMTYTKKILYRLRLIEAELNTRKCKDMSWRNFLIMITKMI